MTIDKTDINREDNRRIEQRQDETRRDNKARKNVATFQAQYQSMAQNRKKETDPKKDHETKGKESETENQGEGLLFKIVQSVKSDQEKSFDEKSGEEHKELIKKDEDKKDDNVGDKNKSTKSQKDSSTLSETHKRVDSLEQQQQDSGSGGGSGGGHSGQNSQSGGGNSGGQNQSGTHSDRHSGGEKEAANFGRQKIAPLGKSDEGFKEGGDRSWNQSLNELVEAIFVGVNKEGHQELLLKLNDAQLAGISLSVVKKPEGLHIKLICENKSTRNKLVIERLKLFERLKKKNLIVVRIDIE